uniref:Cilia and flagella associated protein 99 n=1 Tax=Echeneis naucrates TaxID=173247 RepID=A0A665WJL0_ECHNA
MASNHGSLVREAIELLDKFTAGRQCLDDFIEDASKALQNKDFILDVVSGCIEHKNLLDVVVSVFYGQYGKSLRRGDRNQFVLISYLATFVLDDIGLQSFSNIVKSLDTKKMHTFLKFFFTNLTTWIQEEWNKIYDAEYVEKQWIGPLLRWHPEIAILIDQLAVRISHGSQVKKAPIKTTKPEEFLLTKPKPRSLPMPVFIPQQEKCKPVSCELLYEANMKQFRCVNPQKSEHTKTNNWPIKLNSAAILRQGALYDRQVEEELQRMERLIQGAREPSSFLQWQREMHERDVQEELAKIECRRLEGRISYEEAAMARTRKTFREIAQCAKLHEASLFSTNILQKKLMRQYAKKRLQEEKDMRDMVQQVAEGHKNSKMAKERLQKFKQSIVSEVSEQSQKLLRQALEEAQAELSRKFEIICEIRTLESLPHIRVKNFDDTEIAGHELLGEMSLAELKERLALLKAAQQTEQQEKREHILEVRLNKKQLLLEQMDTIDLHRRALAQAAAIRSGKCLEKKSRLGFQQTVTQDETLLALQKKLEEKQQERQRLRRSESKHENNNLLLRFLFCQKSLKETSWEELELSLERHIQKDAPYEVSQRETLKT